VEVVDYGITIIVIATDFISKETLFTSMAQIPRAGSDNVIVSIAKHGRVLISLVDGRLRVWSEDDQDLWDQDISEPTNEVIEDMLLEFFPDIWEEVKEIE
jgi:hypothetical protein